MLEQGQGAGEVSSLEACEDHMLPQAKGYHQHLICPCTRQASEGLGDLLFTASFLADRIAPIPGNSAARNVFGLHT